MVNVNNYIFIFFVGAFCSFVFVFPGLTVARLLKLIDYPSSEPHKIHKKPTPLAGGLALFAALLVLNSLFFQNWKVLTNVYSALAVTIIFITGVIDDKYVLKPHQKLFGQTIASTFLVLGGFHTNIFVSFPALDIIISIFWFLGIINAFNFMDSADGIILEIGMVITSALIIFTQLSNQPDIQLFCIGFLGIQVGLLYFNVSPAKLFLGDSGAQLIGITLAVLTLLYNPLGHDRTSSWITPILMMAVPIFDVSLVVYSRLKRRIAIYSGGLDHTFHRLVNSGYSYLKARLMILLAVAITNIVAYVLLKMDRIIAFLVFILVVAIGIFIIIRMEKTYE